MFTVFWLTDLCNQVNLCSEEVVGTHCRGPAGAAQCIEVKSSISVSKALKRHIKRSVLLGVLVICTPSTESVVWYKQSRACFG